MQNPKQLTRAEIQRAASDFTWMKKMPKWTVMVEGRELPARPLVLVAAGVLPNDPTNSHQAVAVLESLGFETRYEGKDTKKDAGTKPGAPSEQATDTHGLMETVARIRESVPAEVWEKVPRDLAKNHDHYLYGTKKVEE